MTRTIPCDRCRVGLLLPGEAAVSRIAYQACLCFACREERDWHDEAPDAEGEELWFCEPVVGDYELTLMEVT
jgi:hypothetical protein